MSLKTFKPYTKTTRGTILVDKSNLWKGKPYKPLTSANNSSKGRNNLEELHQKIMVVDTSINTEISTFIEKTDMIGTIERVEYDPNRSCHIMLVSFEDNEKFYYLAPQKIKVGDKIQNGSNSEIKNEIVYH